MKNNLHEILIVTRCPFCGGGSEVEVNEMDYLDWQDGELVQDAFPYLSADDREILISGICRKCQKSLFKDEPGDDEDDDFFL